jgi:hypothetical protein
MAGALLQLVAYGAQDLYLTGQPQITFFKVVYRRYTNFAMEEIEMTTSGDSRLGRTITVIVPRSGDLLKRVWLELDWNMPLLLPAYYSGIQALDTVEISVGGQTIDKHFGEWMFVFAQLTLSQEEFIKFDRLVSGQLINSQGNSKCYIPLMFWFCNNPGLALPLIALQYHEVKLEITFKDRIYFAIPDPATNFVATNTAATTTTLPANLVPDRFIASSLPQSRYIRSVTVGTQIPANTYTFDATDPTVTNENYSATGGVSFGGVGDITVAAPTGITIDRIIPNAGVTTTSTSTVTVTTRTGGANTTFTVTLQPILEISNLRVWGEYIFLDTDERRRFAQMSHEYLIEQIQTSNSNSVNADSGSGNIELRFNHPIKYLTIIAQNSLAGSTATDGTAEPWFNFFRNNRAAVGGAGYASNPVSNLATINLQFNGSDRFKVRDASYFQTVQLFDTFKGGHLQTTPCSTIALNADPPLPMCGGFYVYSFALRPGEHQPSGTCNFSRLDSSVLVLTYNQDYVTAGGLVRVYGVNYNILRIVSGMAGVAYSN